ncbi:MAG: hypothetical protein HYU66_22760 [Armatimonadetes bacterium]|nr:hypothetical protein [Armatimonadota bacterium]
MPPQTQGGHLELPKLLGSPAIDYFAAPYDYSHRLMGDDGRTRAVVDAFALAGKAHMIEDDTRTSLHPVDEYGRAPDVASSIAATRRMFGTALIHRTALWWCDFGASGGGGWYDDPALIGEIRGLYQLAERRLRRPASDVAQVALVADPEGCYYVADGPAMRTHYALVDRVTGALHRTGAPFDFILLSQLARADLRRYKVLVFLDVLQADAAQRAVLKRAVAGRAAIWLWAPGITDGRSFGPELVRDLTGVPVELQGEGVTASESLVAPEVPFTAGLPLRAVDELEPAERTPLAAAADPASWYNPRDAETMQRSYSQFEVTAAEGGIDWRVATTDGWSDVHLKAAVETCDGLGLTVTATEALVGTGLRVVVKDADAAEFAGAVQPLSGTPQTWNLALAGFSKAPWYKGPAERIRFPLTGLKLVLYAAPGGRAGTLRLRDLAALHGPVRHSEVRLYDGPGLPQTCLTIQGTQSLLAANDGSTPVFYSALAALPVPVLTAVLEQSGVHRYVTRPDVLVQADSTLLILHTAVGGRCSIKLPRPERLTDALTGEVVGEGTEVTLELPGPSTTLLERWPIGR